MSDPTGTPPAGWYNDPSIPNQQRWWDGGQWSTSTRPLTDGPHPTAPVSAPTPGGVPPIVAESGRGRSTRNVVLAVVGAGFVLAGCVTLLASSSTDPRASSEDRFAEIATDATPVEPVPPPTAPAQEPEPADDTTDDTADETGRFGTREDPLPFDQPVDVTWASFGDGDGSVWTTTIGPPRDITDEVLAANQFNDPPPDGVRFVGFEAELTLVEAAKEPLAPGFNFSWEILGGATARVYGPATIETTSFGCGVTPNSFDDFAEVFTGGTLTGTVCIPIPTEDLDHPDTRVSLDFSDGDRAIFGP